MSVAYLAGLSVSLLGLGFLDWRYRVALFADARRTLSVLGLGVAVFLVWDIVGVGLGIFFRGASPYLSGVLVAPEVPLEEVFFLTLLVYQTLLLWLAFSRRAAGVGAGGARGAVGAGGAASAGEGELA